MFFHPQYFSKVVAPSLVSSASFTVSAQPHLVIPMSWFRDTLPAVQWLAALMAAVSGMFAVWSFISQKFRKK